MAIFSFVASGGLGPILCGLKFMAEPTSNIIVASLWATFSGFTILFFGANAQLIVLALVGSAFAILTNDAPSTPRSKLLSLFTWASVTIVAAVLAAGFGEWAGLGTKATGALAVIIAGCGTSLSKKLVGWLDLAIVGLINKVTK